MQQFHDSLKEYTNSVSPIKLLSMGIVDLESGAISTVSNNTNNISNTHNINNEISCILKGDKTIYCTTMKKNVNILFKFMESRSCVFTSLLIKVPENPSSKGAPLHEFMVFVSDEPIDVNATSRYDDFTEEHWNDFLDAKKGCNEPVKRDEPMLYYKFKSNQWCTVVDLPIPRYGQYVLVKLLRSRISHEPIEIQYIGFKGFIGGISSSCASLI
jgi:hypothetical protein